MAKTGATTGNILHKNIVFNGSSDNRSNAVQKSANVVFILESAKTWYFEHSRLLGLKKFIVNNQGLLMAKKDIIDKLANKSILSLKEEGELKEATEFVGNYEDNARELKSIEEASTKANSLLKENNGNMTSAKAMANKNQEEILKTTENKKVCPYCGKEECSGVEKNEEKKETPKRKSPKCLYPIGSINFKSVELKNNQNFSETYFEDNFMPQKHHMISFQRYIEAVGARNLGDKVKFDINNGWGNGENGIELPAIKPKNPDDLTKNLWTDFLEEDKKFVASQYMQLCKKQWHVGDHSGIYDIYYLPYEKCISSRLIEIEEFIIKSNSKNCKCQDNEEENLEKIKELLNKLMKDIKDDLDNFLAKSLDKRDRIFFTSKFSYSYYNEDNINTYEADEKLIKRMEEVLGKKKAKKFIYESLKR